MGYSNELYQEAAEILSRRRKHAISERENRRTQLREKCPELLRIEGEMAAAGLSVTKVLLEGKRVEEQLERLKQTSLALQMERSELLRLQNLPPDHLSFRFCCSHCEDTGFADGKICSCHLQLLRKLTLERIQVSAPLAESTFDRFQLDYYPNETDQSGMNVRTRMRMILQFCQDYAKSFHKNAGSILMSGETGLGKTHLSLAIAHEVIERGYSVEYASAQMLFSQLEREHFSKSEERKGRYEGQILNADLLILDDLGAEFCTQFTVAALYNIVNSRLLQRKPIIVNTNVSAQELEGKYTRRITSRIFGNYALLGFEGKDIRQLKALSREG